MPIIAVLHFHDSSSSNSFTRKCNLTPNDLNNSLMYFSMGYTIDVFEFDVNFQKPESKR